MSDIKEPKTVVATWEWLETPCDDPLKVEKDGDEIRVSYGPEQSLMLDIRQMPALVEMLNRAMWER